MTTAWPSDCSASCSVRTSDVVGLVENADPKEASNTSPDSAGISSIERRSRTGASPAKIVNCRSPSSALLMWPEL
ncbi:hypothetical protein D3C73_1334910 [compost metagenome]